MTVDLLPKPIYILLVDDNPNNLKVLSEAIQGCGWKTLMATDGESAIEQIEYAHPDLILLDVGMPGIDGFETCRRLKANPNVQTIPVIFMTAFSDATDKVKGLEIGAVDYITKPFQQEEVIARLKLHLKLYHLTYTLEERVKERTAELEQANQQLAEYSQCLEQRVEARTQELSQTLSNLQTAQTELIQAEKMAALGQLTASIAHEINTPLGVIRGATSNIAAACTTMLQQLPTLLQGLSPMQRADFLQLVQTSLQQQHSLSTKEERQLRHQWQAVLLAQGLANAPHIAGQLAMLQLDQNLTAYQSILHAPNCADILTMAYNLVLQQQSTRNIQQEVDRAAKIVFALKTYSHQGCTDERSLVSLTDGIEVALTLHRNRLKQGIAVCCHYNTPMPSVLCNPDEMIQVWVNLIDNAIYAMGQQGTLAINVVQQESKVVVSVTDSGCGIAPEFQARIFQPFFTTKPQGEGSGLGLDIVRQIVQKHGGSIQVHSQPNRTTFTVALPLNALSEC